MMSAKAGVVFAGILCLAPFVRAQSGACTESGVKHGDLESSDNAFVYMPPYGKPAAGNSEIDSANKKSFSDRTNITRSWEADHRVVVAPSGDMAYEHGTLKMGYDDKSDGKHHEFKAVILAVYRTEGGTCKQVALTMQPLDEQTDESKK